MRPCPATILALCLIASPAAAGDLPQFDTPTYCKVVAVALGPYLERIYEGCLRIEAAAYAQALWSVTAPETRGTCVTVASLNGSGSSKVLVICLSTKVGSSAPSRGT